MIQLQNFAYGDFRVLTLLLIFISHQCNVGRTAVTLTSSVEHDAACPGEVVVYTCTASRTSSVGWRILPDIVEFDYFVSSPIGEIQIIGDSQVVLTEVLNPSAGLADLTTNLTVTATPIQHGRRVTCIGDEPDEMSILILSITSLPSPPQSPSYTVQHYGPYNVTVTVQWGYPEFDGGAPVDNYTINGTGFITTTSQVNQTTLTLPYSMSQNIGVTATNCNGTSEAATFTYYEAGCGEPIPPSGVFIGDFQSAAEGSTITYSCGPGLVPTAQMSVCTSMTWRPDPATLECREPLPVESVGVTSPTQTSRTTPTLGSISTPNSIPTQSSTPTLNSTPTLPGSTPVSQMQPWLIPVVAIIGCVLVLICVIIIVIGVVVGLNRRSGPYAKRLKSTGASYQIELQSQEEPSNSVEPSNTGLTVDAQYSQLGGSVAVKQRPGLMYAELGPNSQEIKIQRPPSGDNVGVQYSSVLHGEAATKAAVQPADKSLDLDNLLVQLQNVSSSKWYQLGEALGVSTESLNQITTSFPSAPDQCKIEMLDFWLRNRTSGGQATWREVAGALTRIHEGKLASELMGVYTTGTLPILVDMRSLPRSPGVLDDPPPPVPPKYSLEEEKSLPSPMLPENGGPHQAWAVAPPRPPKSSPLPPRPPKSSQESAAFPPRPPKTNQELPPRPPKTNQEEGTAVPPRPAKTHQQSVQQPGPVAPPRPPKSHSRGPPRDAPPRPPKPGSS